VLDEAMASWSALLYFREIYGEQKAAAILEDQLQGVYRHTELLAAKTWTRTGRRATIGNTFQYAAVVTTKGALMFVQFATSAR